MGSEGPSRLYTTYPVRAKGLILVPAFAPHGYLNEDVFTLALSVFGPSLEPDEPDWHEVPDEKKSEGRR